MRLLSIFRRDGTRDRAPTAADSGDAVAQARTRARRRLIGAAVLLVVGVIGFPLVFETRPRPIPIDIPIEIPKKDGAPALVMPPARAPTADAADKPIARNTTPPDDMITESSADAGREVTASTPISADGQRAKALLEARPIAKAATEVKPAAKPAPESKPATKPATESNAAAKTQAAPVAAAKPVAPAKPGSSADGARFVVQVGAYAEADSARDARAKVEKLGLKTYTQVAPTPAGNRIRVRVGPFSSRAEADAALAKARSAGVAAVVLTL